MEENSALEEIKKSTLLILDEKTELASLEENIKSIHAHFQKLTNISGFDQELTHMAAIPAAKGKALGLNFAAQCLLDFNRTILFFRAIVSTIKEKQNQHPNETIELFYAGCGPYAPLFTLIAPLFKPNEIKYTLLEINSTSVNSANKLIEALELKEYIEDFHTADAITFQVENANKYHILISETLDALLYRECYVPILFNLLPQFNEDITLIPENVMIDVSLLKHSESDKSFKTEDLDNIVNVRKAIENHSNESSIPEIFSDVKIDLSKQEPNTYDSLLIDTSVHVHKDLWLRRNESSLTLPLEVKADENSKKSTVRFIYQVGQEIELKIQVLPN